MLSAVLWSVFSVEGSFDRRVGHAGVCTRNVRHAIGERSDGKMGMGEDIDLLLTHPYTHKGRFLQQVAEHALPLCRNEGQRREGTEGGGIGGRGRGGLRVVVHSFCARLFFSFFFFFSFRHLLMARGREGGSRQTRNRWCGCFCISHGEGVQNMLANGAADGSPPNFRLFGSRRFGVPDMHMTCFNFSRPGACRTSPSKPVLRFALYFDAMFARVTSLCGLEWPFHSAFFFFCFLIFLFLFGGL